MVRPLALLAALWLASCSLVRAADSANDALDEVLVTTRYREEKAQDVPLPLAVVSGEELTSTNTYRLQDIGALFPSVNVVVTNPRQNSLSVRGIGNNPANEGLFASTGVFLDGVYLGRPGMALFDLTDIERVELARGPQGTLSGKNTTAGALNILTRKPSFTPGGDVEITLGNFSNREFKADITGPLVGDTIAGRLSAYSTHSRGFVDDPATDTDYYGYSREGVRGQLLAVASQHTSVRAIAEYDQEDDTIGPPLPYAGPASPTAPFWQYMNQLKADAAANGVQFFGPQYPLDPDARQVFLDAYYRALVKQGALTTIIDHDFGSGYQLTSITGYRFWNSHPYNDGDNTNLPIVPAAGLQNHDKQYSQEVRLSSPSADRVNFTSGLYFFRQEEHVQSLNAYGSNLAYLEDYFGTITKTSYTRAAASFASRYINATNTTDGQLDTNSYAAYSQANLRATDALTLTAGLRDTYERQTLDLTRNFNNTPPSSPTNPSLQSGNYSIGTNTVGGTVAAAYRVSEEFNVYTSYAHGGKAGALNNLPPASPLTSTGIIVRPETVNDGELGFKSTLLDHTLILNANLYYTVVNNYQATGTFFDPNKPPAGGLSTGLTNVGAISSKGVEVESSWRPVRNVTISLDGSYNDARYRSFPNGPCPYENPGTATVCDLTGKPVAGAPKWIASLTASYEHPLTQDVSGYVTGEYNYRSSYFGPGVTDDSQYSLNRGYGLTELWIGARVSRIDISLWARNLFNVKYTLSTTGGGASGYYTSTPGDPRTFGVLAKMSF